MLIRKLFKFENAHVVRSCSTVKCRSSIHGHSYKIEVLLESNYLDDGQMIYDFGLMKLNIKDVIDSFDHSITIWNKDNQEYINDMKNHSDRWVELPVSPSAEQFSRVFFVIIDRLLDLTITKNGEREVKLHSIIVHETATGYAQCFKEDAYSLQMGEILLNKVNFSTAVQSDWHDSLLWTKTLNKEKFINPKDV
ncbi:6-pyruvoyl trahydropterin synthase family protein [Clostridium sp.]|jgi:6-pyruvoyltetrahydropterin/6-carboxytetrahydropterin synthase|uniref:6-pyruvoyl trahydropterin synthase family protein n=1 Tax=Clostridium sp. TaxID=1506 RepID=UPI003EE87D83